MGARNNAKERDFEIFGFDYRHLGHPVVGNNRCPGRLLAPLTSQHTGSEPCRSIYASLEQLGNETFFSADIAMGFPPADIYHAGPSVVAYAGTQVDADKAAEALLQTLLDAESDFDDVLQSPQASLCK